MRWIFSLFFFFSFHTAFCVTPSQSLKQLIEGNWRYTHNKSSHADHSSVRRKTLLKKQEPFAVILGCSDSRVAPEIIFDQGLGDLFIVRVAGNVDGATELDSIEYAVKYLGSPLVLVLGHEGCGAVNAVMEGNTADIEDVAELIRPAIHGAKTLEEAVKENVRWTVESLKKTPILKKLIREKKISCLGAYYHLDTGKVELLDKKKDLDFSRSH